jgi:hypothetical protein
MPAITWPQAMVALATSIAVATATVVGLSVSSDPPSSAADVPAGLTQDAAPAGMKFLQETGTTHGDSFSSPEVLTGYWPSVLFDTTNATTQSGEQRRVGAVRQLRRTMWAKWKAPESGFVSFAVWNVGGAVPLDTGINVYTGSVISTLHRVASNDDQYFPVETPPSTTGPKVWSEILGMQVTKGTTYYIQIGTATDLSATLNSAVPGHPLVLLSVQGSSYTEPNDFLAKAATLTLGPGATVSTNAYVNGSTMETWEPTANLTEPPAKRIGSVWYKWTAPQNGNATLGLCSYEERMSIAVFENWNSAPGTGVGDMSVTAFGFNNLVCPGFNTGGALAYFTAKKDVTYFIQVAKTVPIAGNPGGADQFGELTLRVDFSSVYIEKITPSSGSTSGGTTLTFTGQDFVTGMVVHFGSKSVNAPAGVSPTSFTIKSPSHSAGAVSVTITSGVQTSNAKTYTYK